MENKKIVVIGGYKTGTSTLVKTFKCVKYHHIADIDKILKNNLEVEIILFPFRNNNEVYPSAYFQDICNPLYEYSPFYLKNPIFENFLNQCSSKCIPGLCYCENEIKRQNIIKNVDINELLRHYKTINWDKYDHLNSILRIDYVKKYNVNINYNSLEFQIFNIEINNKIIKLISFNICILDSKFDELKKIINCNNNIVLQKENISNIKWYANKYKEFIKGVNENI